MSLDFKLFALACQVCHGNWHLNLFEDISIPGIEIGVCIDCPFISDISSGVSKCLGRGNLHDETIPRGFSECLLERAGPLCRRVAGRFMVVC